MVSELVALHDDIFCEFHVSYACISDACAVEPRRRFVTERRKKKEESRKLNPGSSAWVIRPKASFITNIEEWTSAFTAYVSVIISKHLNCAAELLEYLSLIRYAAKYHRGLGWCVYDVIVLATTSTRVGSVLGPPAPMHSSATSQVVEGIIPRTGAPPPLNPISSHLQGQGNLTVSNMAPTTGASSFGDLVSPVNLLNLQIALSNHPNREFVNKLYLVNTGK